MEVCGEKEVLGKNNFVKLSFPEKAISHNSAKGFAKNSHLARNE